MVVPNLADLICVLKKTVSFPLLFSISSKKDVRHVPLDGVSDEPKHNGCEFKPRITSC